MELAQQGAKYGQYAALGATLLASNGDLNVITVGNQTAVTAVENNTLLHAAVGAMAVAGTAITIYDTYDAYASAGGGEEGSIAALKVLSKDVAINFLAGGAVKIGSKIYPSAKLAFSSYISSSQVAQNIGESILSKSGQVVDGTTETIINGWNNLANTKAVPGIKGFVSNKVIKNADEVNAPFVDEFVSKGVPRENVVTPWVGDVTEFTITQEQKVYRVFSNRGNEADKWVFTQKTLDEANTLVLQGKYATKYDALQDMLSIPTKPTNLAKGTIPSGTTFRTGTAGGGAIKGKTFNGGAQQIEIPNGAKESWFEVIE
jgi:hypothetical protein